MRLITATLVGCLLLVACKFPFPADVPDDDASASDGSVDAPACTPRSAVCANGALTVCDANGNAVSYQVPNGGSDGTPVEVTLHEYPCPLGCAQDGQRCADVAPSNGLAGALDSATLEGPDVVIDDPDSAVLSTTSELQNGYAFVFEGLDPIVELPIPAVIVPQTNAPDILVLVVRSFTVKPGVKLRVAGTRAFAIVSHLDIYIGGTLDASGAVIGAGTSTDPACNVVAQAGILGGGGNRDAGGASSTGGAGGQPRAQSNATLMPLEGGCGSERVAGLGGGGGVQLVSRTKLVLGPAGVISVAGNKGTGRLNGGQLLLTGGGSGGNLRIEAPTIAIHPGSRIVGRGGSGAAANTVNNSFQNGVAGDADLSATSVPGPTCAGCGVGGNGGTTLSAPAAGQGGGTMVASGGGSVGRCVLATRSGVVAPPAGSMMIASQNAAIGIR